MDGINTLRHELFRKIKSALAWLTVTGLLLLAIQTTYNFFTGSVDLEYIKSLKHGYKFKLLNHMPDSRKIVYFRILPDLKESFIYITTRDVESNVTKTGISLPGGNELNFSAFEFKELNGQVISSDSNLSFRLPPLSSRPYVEPEAVSVFVQYKTKPNSMLLNLIEELLLKIGVLYKRTHTIKYHIIDNYWTRVGPSDHSTAVEVYCKEDDLLCKDGEVKSKAISLM